MKLLLVSSMGYVQQPFSIYFLNLINRTCSSGKELEELSTAQVKSVHNAHVTKRKLQ